MKKNKKIIYTTLNRITRKIIYPALKKAGTQSEYCVPAFFYADAFPFSDCASGSLASHGNQLLRALQAVAHP